MNLSELQRKDIVNILTGKKLGRIVDAIMNEKGYLEYFIIQDRNLLFFWKPKEEFNITIPQIEKIGYDVILVRLEESLN